MANFWGGSWGTSWGASWDLREVLPEPTPAAPSSASGVKRRKPRIYVEIDDQLFPADSEREAQELLRQARKTAKEVVKKVRENPKLPQVQIPIVTAGGSEVLERLAAETQKYVAEQYKKALAIQQDDDDIEVLLLSL